MISVFEDDEYETLIGDLNAWQMIFHHEFAPVGILDIRRINELRNKRERIVFIDNNILSPICDCVLHGTAQSELSLRKTAALIVFAKSIGAALCSAFALTETDATKKNNIAADRRNQLFLYAVDGIPVEIWKKIAFGYLNEIPPVFLKDFSYSEESVCLKSEYNLLYSMLQAALTKIVNLYRVKSLSGFDKFMSFLEWYTDNLLISESVMMYAALLFGNVEGIRCPKNINSDSYDDIVAGISNQAWDLFYVSEWSKLYYNEDGSRVYFFATDDKTLKNIIVNIFPKNTSAANLGYIFKTKNQRRVLTDFFNDRYGKNRIRPFAVDDEKKGREISARLLLEERAKLKSELS